MAESGQKGPASVNITRTELVWPGKYDEQSRLRPVERVALPFQVVETINQSRAHQPALQPAHPEPVEGRAGHDGWKNKLVWGDNKYVMASLLQGDPASGLEPLAGKVDLIYIDPPFATGQDFSYRARVGDEEWLKESSIIEKTAYRDTWGRGLESYLQMMYERLVLMRELLAERGSIYVHIGPHVCNYVKLLLDEVFGHQMAISEIIWKRQQAHSDAKTFANLHDVILFYTKTEKYTFTLQYIPYTDKHVRENYRYQDGKGVFALGQLKAPHDQGPRYEWRGITRHWRYTKENMDKLEQEGRLYCSDKGLPWKKLYLDEMPGVVAGTIWADLNPIHAQDKTERLDYETQKPEGLLERILRASSTADHLVADLFCGSGTTMAVAEKLGRRWIGCDLSRYAIQVSRKRLLDIPDCKPFQVLNLGKYERKHWQVNILNSHPEPAEGGHQSDSSAAVADYLRFIVALYQADPSAGSGGYAHLHGQKAGRWVHVGAADAPVTRAEIMDAVRECQANRYTALDVLGWEWEMGLHDTVREEARRMGVDLRLLFIPREVMDKRAVQAGDVHFYELAYLKASVLQDSRTVTVKLEDFIIPNPDLVPDEVRSKVKRWSDYIDFWAVDWDYRQDTFHNEWQTYRTRKSPTLRLLSDPHTYAAPGKYRVLVKVIDIFGNDTTQLSEVKL